jgi:hypothetical protein
MLRSRYPAVLEIAAGPGIQKAYVYRPGNSDSMKFEVGSGGSIKDPATNKCLAARGEYMPPATGIAGVQIWAKPLGKGRTAALFINGGSAPYSASIALGALNLTARDGSRMMMMGVEEEEEGQRGVGGERGGRVG